MNEFARQYLERRERLGFPRSPTRPIVVPPAPLPPPEPPQPVVVVQLPPPKPKTWSPHWRQIVDEVAKKHELHPRDLLGHSRQHRIVVARNEAFYRLRNEIIVIGRQISLPEIARRFDKDHSSVLHGIRKHAALIASKSVNPTSQKKAVATQKSWCSMEDHRSNAEVVA